MAISRLQTILVLLALIGGASSRALAEGPSWVGEQVFPKKPTKEVQFVDRVSDKGAQLPLADRWPIKVWEEREGWLRIHDGHQWGWVQKADFLLVRDAPAYFHLLVQANQKNRWALLMRAEAWFLNGGMAKALNDFNELIRLDPTDAPAFRGRGNVRSIQREYDQAIKDYDEAIRLDPKNALTFNNRGRAKEEKKEHDKAIQDYDEAIRLDPRLAIAFNNRGLVWSAKQDYERALKDLDEAVRLDSMYANAFRNRGETWSTKSEYDRAIKDFDEAIRLDPKQGVTFTLRTGA